MICGWFMNVFSEINTFMKRRVITVFTGLDSLLLARNFEKIIISRIGLRVVK